MTQMIMNKDNDEQNNYEVEVGDRGEPAKRKP